MLWPISSCLIFCLVSHPFFPVIFLKTSHLDPTAHESKSSTAITLHFDTEFLEIQLCATALSGFILDRVQEAISRERFRRRWSHDTCCAGRARWRRGRCVGGWGQRGCCSWHRSCSYVCRRVGGSVRRRGVCDGVEVESEPGRFSSVRFGVVLPSGRRWHEARHGRHGHSVGLDR